MAFDGCCPTDVPAQAILRRLFGCHPILMQHLEAAVWAAVALVGTGLAQVGLRAWSLPGTVSIARALPASDGFGHGRRDASRPGRAGPGARSRAWSRSARS